LSLYYPWNDDPTATTNNKPVPIPITEEVSSASDALKKKYSPYLDDVDYVVQ